MIVVVVIVVVIGGGDSIVVVMWVFMVAGRRKGHFVNGVCECCVCSLDCTFTTS